MTKYDYRPDKPINLLYPIKPGKKKWGSDQESISLYFGDIFDQLGREGRLAGEALREWEKRDVNSI